MTHKKNSNWHLPKDVVFTWSILLVIPIIAILTAVLIPVFARLKTLEPVIFYCYIGGSIGILGIILFFVARTKIKRKK